MGQVRRESYLPEGKIYLSQTTGWGLFQALHPYTAECVLHILSPEIAPGVYYYAFRSFFFFLPKRLYNSALSFTIFCLLNTIRSPETASTSFVTKPSDPSFAVEGRNFTLKWTYTLDGMVHISQFFNINSGGIELIGKRRGPGHITTGPKYQARFRIEATDTQAELKIFAVQRSDQSTYQINVDPCGSGSLTHDVTVIVQCKF